MLASFYSAFAAITFTVLGLWFVVVQTRHRDWAPNPELRRRAQAVSFHFAFPGLMSLLSLVDPKSKVIWRVAFAISALVAAGALALLARSPKTLWQAASALAVLLYLAIAVIAIAPKIVSPAKPLEVVAILLSLVVFLGVNLAWLLMFDEAA